MVETYLIHELDNPNWKPEPHEFLLRENAIARSRVVPDKTMGVYRVTRPEGKWARDKVLIAITQDNIVTEIDVSSL